MRIIIGAALYVVCSIQRVWADCGDLNRQALPNKAALQSATNEYKNSAASDLRETLKGTEKPPINVIAEGVAATTKMISAMDATIRYLRSVQDAGCVGKDAGSWGVAITKMEAQLDDMRQDRKTYIEILSLMSKSEQRPPPSTKSSQYLTSSAREDFIRGTANGCMRAKTNEGDMRIIPNSLFEGYCRCYATSLADKVTIADMQSDNKAATDPIMKSAARTCYQGMKAEALRLYNAGQYPKQ